MCVCIHVLLVENIIKRTYLRENTDQSKPIFNLILKKSSLYVSLWIHHCIIINQLSYTPSELFCESLKMGCKIVLYTPC